MIKKNVLLIVVVMFLYNCAKKDHYSNTPQISYKSFNLLSQDSALLSINFIDGDGNIGNSSDGNFFIIYYFWNPTLQKYKVFKNAGFLQDTIDVRNFSAPSSIQHKPISGEIGLIMSPYRADDTIKKLKYSVYIKDNSGNQSNIIQTPEINVP